MLGLLGKKVGMTQIFENDQLVPVTVIEAGPNFVLQKKTVEKEGYNAIQVGYDEKKEKNTNKPMKGIFDKAEVKPVKYIREFEIDNLSEYELGQELKVDLFEKYEYVDVAGISKGKGFAGGMKRHGFSGGMKSHGNSRAHRVLGSIGQSSTPAKVLKGKKMAGRLGGDRVTVQNLKIMKIDAENNVLLVKGAVPGAKNGYLIIKPAIKKY
ncbi:MAG: 50S ribosomal protein L3 [Fusobacteria bacterium]|jgi:large subunit ribosomal protein L3|nr:50S ribosomal protein L3 [Fusobacteriota bacterium]